MNILLLNGVIIEINKLECHKNVYKVKTFLKKQNCLKQKQNIEFKVLKSYERRQS